MDPTERPLLNDKNEYPHEQVLSNCLGRAKVAWDAFGAGIIESFPGTSLEWRYYNDGKSWLCKVTRSKKTVCWVSVWPKSFRVSFYFTQQSDAAIQKLDIAAALKAEYRSRQSVGKLKPLRVTVTGKKQLNDVFELVKFKLERLSAPRVPAQRNSPPRRETPTRGAVRSGRTARRATRARRTT